MEDKCLILVKKKKKFIYMFTKTDINGNHMFRIYDSRIPWN